MADYYTTFSEGLVLKGGKRAADWVNRYLDQFDGVMAEPGTAKHKAQEDLAVLYDLDPDYFQLGFDWEIHSSPKKQSEVWLYCEEHGNPDHVAQFVKTYLRKFDPKGCFSFTWAQICSKPRQGAFTGGAIFVTANEIEWMSGEQWAGEKETKFKKKMDKEAKKTS